MSKLKIYSGDVYEHTADAIVNPANYMLLEGGGVCGRIFKAERDAGGLVLDSWTRLANERGIVVPVGSAILGPLSGTAGFDYCIHAVAPDLRRHDFISGRNTEEIPGHEKLVLLAATYNSVISIAQAAKMTSIVCPSLGTGIFGWRHEDAADIAVNAIKNHPWPGTVSLVIFNPDDLPTYNDEL